MMMGFLTGTRFACTQKKVYFKDIGRKVKEGQDLAAFFVEVYKRHHGEGNKVSFELHNHPHIMQNPLYHNIITS